MSLNPTFKPSARIYGFHPDTIQPAPQIPANLKCPTDWVLKFEQFVRASRKAALELRADRREALDELESRADEIKDGIEQLQGAEYDREQLLEASTGVLLVLSRLWLDDSLTSDEKAAVSNFREAVAEAQS